MNLLTGHVDAINQVSIDLFDSFKRVYPVTFYKSATETIVSLDPNFNSDLQESTTSTLTEHSQNFYCRIIFNKRESTFYTSIPNTPTTAKTEQDFQEISLQMEADAYEYAQSATRFQIQGINYQKLGSFRKIGILDTFILFQVYLKRVN